VKYPGDLLKYSGDVWSNHGRHTERYRQAVEVKWYKINDYLKNSDFLDLHDSEAHKPLIPPKHPKKIRPLLPRLWDSKTDELGMRVPLLA
jgi:hypothetical protein|tara:strand:- start:653 stop:922 length:270 start_codon:yes stop_codon:yes gene_type:complete